MYQFRFGKSLSDTPPEDFRNSTPSVMESTVKVPSSRLCMSFSKLMAKIDDYEIRHKKSSIFALYSRYRPGDLKPSFAPDKYWDRTES
jgi:hypothetical protein